MTDNKQTVLTDGEIEDLLAQYNSGRLPPSANFLAAFERAVLSKLRAGREPIGWIDINQLREMGDAWVYQCDPGHVAEPGEIPVFTAPQASAEARKPDGYAYRYHDGVRALRFNNGEPINGCRPFEAVPYYLGSAPSNDSQASAEESAIDKPIPDSVEHYGLIDERVGAPAAEDSAKRPGDLALPWPEGAQAYHAGRGLYETHHSGPGKAPFSKFADIAREEQAYWIVLADRQQRGGDVATAGFLENVRELADRLMGCNPSRPQMREAARLLQEFYLDQRAALAAQKADGGDVGEPPPITARYGTQEFDHQTAFAEGWQAAHAALADKPAASAEPVNRQAIADRFAFLEGVVNEHNYRLIVDTVCALAAHKTGGGDAKDADPLQGAADWLVAALAKPRPTEIAARLLIGYNRAERLYDAAISAQQRQGAATANDREAK